MSGGAEREEAFQTLKNELCVKDKILATLSETPKVENAPAEMLRDMDQQMENRADDGEGEASKAVRAYYNNQRYLNGSGKTSPWTSSQSYLEQGVGTMRYGGNYSTEKLARLYTDEIVARHGVHVSIILDHDARFTSRLSQTFQKAIGTRLDMSTAYHPQIDGQIITLAFGALRSKHYMEENVGHLCYGLKLGKSYADNRRKPLEFEVGDRVMLKVSPWKGVVHFGKKGKLASRYVGPFEILKRIGSVAYRLRLPNELSGVHNTFHMSNLKKCLADASLHVPLNEIKVDKTLRFVEEPVEIMDHEIKSLKRSKISLAKVNDYLILCANEFGVKYSICSRVVIMEMKDVLHALLRQFLVFKS
ncbi:putative reverse transcriptase domain-containing protein [Tanacetum coccineum]|uniref:Reverse transcriptase domain-containing protein n=1 Tax=Tanacetum coccineum TaxID=301880 RepID=A0ABQ4XTU1_9ASTR